jgi:hypothetical protein
MPMPKSWIVLALLLAIPLPVAAQTITARVIRAAVVLSQPRGDSGVITTISPGFIVEVGARAGDWYQVVVNPEDRARRVTGWLPRAAVELLSGSNDPTPQSQPISVPAQTAAEPSRSSGAAAATSEEPVLHRGTIEMIVDGNISAVTSAGETVALVEANALVGFVVVPAFEVVVTGSIAKIEGNEAIGAFGAGLIANFKDDGRVIPFVGATFGRSAGVSGLLGGFVNDVNVVNLFGGFRVMTRGGGGALVVRPFYDHYFISSDFLETADVHQFGVALGISVLF